MVRYFLDYVNTIQGLTLVCLSLIASCAGIRLDLGREKFINHFSSKAPKAM